MLEMGCITASVLTATSSTRRKTWSLLPAKTTNLRVLHPHPRTVTRVQWVFFELALHVTVLQSSRREVHLNVVHSKHMQNNKLSCMTHKNTRPPPPAPQWGGPVGCSRGLLLKGVGCSRGSAAQWDQLVMGEVFVMCHTRNSQMKRKLT
jgi:hypothetical protein